MNTQHTPGPWITGNSLVPFGITIWKEHDENRNVPRICQNVSTLANAKLIAAAPELLEACQWAIRNESIPRDVYLMLKAAITKATKQD